MQLEEIISLFGAAGGLQRRTGAPKNNAPPNYLFKMRNFLYEDFLTLNRFQFENDYTGQLLQQPAEKGRRAGKHWEMLAVDLLNGAETYDASVADTYDGAAFYGDHSYPSGKTLNNIVTYPVANPDKVTASELASAIAAAYGLMMGFTDEADYSANDDLSDLQLLYPAAIAPTVITAVSADYLAPGQKNPVWQLQAKDKGGERRPLTVDPISAPRLASGREVHLLRTDAELKPLISVERTPIFVEELLAGSTPAVMDNNYVWAIKGERNIGFGQWRYAVKIKFVAA
jgi:phage major head subunit gpT-like protein